MLEYNFELKHNFLQLFQLPFLMNLFKDLWYSLFLNNNLGKSLYQIFYT